MRSGWLAIGPLIYSNPSKNAFFVFAGFFFHPLQKKRWPNVWSRVKRAFFSTIVNRRPSPKNGPESIHFHFVLVSLIHVTTNDWHVIIIFHKSRALDIFFFHSWMCKSTCHSTARRMSYAVTLKLFTQKKGNNNKILSDQVIHFGIFFFGFRFDVLYLFFSSSLSLFGLESYRNDVYRMSKKTNRERQLLLLFYSAFCWRAVCLIAVIEVKTYAAVASRCATLCTICTTRDILIFLRPRNHPAAAVVYIPLRLWHRHAPHLIHNSRAITRSPSPKMGKKRILFNQPERCIMMQPAASQHYIVIVI